MTKEELPRYFLSLDLPPASISPLDEDLARVNAALAREIPTDDVQVADLRDSFFRLSALVEFLELRKNTFWQIALQLGDLSSLYARARNTKRVAQSSL